MKLNVFFLREQSFKKPQEIQRTLLSAGNEVSGSSLLEHTAYTRVWHVEGEADEASVSREFGFDPKRREELWKDYKLEGNSLKYAL